MQQKTDHRTRRSFLRLTGGALVGLLAFPADLTAAARAQAGLVVRHPDPRPGVDSSRVLASTRVPAHLTELYDHVRAMPEVIDGLGCHCGCAEIPGMYSLLSCYEESGMAQYCEICQGEARLAHRLHGEGHSLADIRAAIDRRFG